MDSQSNTKMLLDGIAESNQHPREIARNTDQIRRMTLWVFVVPFVLGLALLGITAIGWFFREVTSGRL